MNVLDAPQRPTAVIGFADPVAVGFLQAVAHAGVRVPENVSVIGVDDLPIAAGTTPPLTTLRAPAESLGETATKALIEDTIAKPQRRTFDRQWGERESTRAINGHETLRISRESP